MFSKSAILAFVGAALAADHVVLVGQNNGLTFTPQTVNAAVGDTVTYQFLTQNHTVTSGNPSVGCSPDGKFNSGFVPVSAAAGAAAPAASAAAGKAGKKGIRGLNNIFDTRAAKTSTFTVAVQNTQPQVVYCAQAQHCQVGMVMVINPAQTGTKSLAAYQALSAKAKTNTLPNTPAGTGGKLVKAGGATAGSTAQGATSATGGAAGGAAKKGGKGKGAGQGLAGLLAGGKKGNKRSAFVY